MAIIAIALEGATPRLFRPTYAGANMGHPSQGTGLYSLLQQQLPRMQRTWATFSNTGYSSHALLPTLVSQPPGAVSVDPTKSNHSGHAYRKTV